MGAAILERDQSFLAVLDVFEFLGVFVANEQEIRPDAFGNGHGARNGADARADCGEKACFQGVNGLVEFLDLLVLGCLIVVLHGHGRICLGIDIAGAEGLRHFERRSVFKIVECDALDRKTGEGRMRSRGKMEIDF